MTSLPAAACQPCQARPARPGRHARVLVLAGLMQAPGLMAAQAVSPSSAEPAGPARAASGSLDRALSGGVSTGDRNLDLLLDTQRSLPGQLDENAGGKMPARASASRSLQAALPEPNRQPEPPVTLPAGQQRGPTAEVALGQVLSAPAAGANPAATRKWGDGGGGGGGNGGGGGSGGGGGYAGAAGPSAPDGHLLVTSDPQLREFVQQSVRFLKDNLVEIGAVCVLIGLAIAGIKAQARRS